MLKNLPDEVFIYIYSYIYPPNNINILKYKYSIIWCKKCGELLSGGDWMLHMNTIDAPPNERMINFMLYTCENCKYDNIYYDEDEWNILLDYIN
tara:strand:- start:2105 stop:2386 length:282 start_codon:yes stop_codon:yes gene_type:complete